jgi:hypothetical protein
VIKTGDAAIGDPEVNDDPRKLNTDISEIENVE